MFTVPKIIKGLLITCLNNMYRYIWIDFDKETDVILQCLQSNFNLINALEKNEILFRLITGIIEVIEQQMYDSNIPTPMASQTLSAPAHNMFAEKTLGLADYHFRNAHNVKIGLVDAKVKSKINKTLPWLCSKPHNEQEKIIKFCIGQAQKGKLLIHTHELYIAKEQDKWLLERTRKKIVVIEESGYKRNIECCRRQCRIVHRVSGGG